ncbi:DUF2116 family Zn-ribbon domain-containing protein [Pseudomonas sp. GD03860]|uniref:DUF2116 family Zn-ribbon domain-containing protein n=1 Tax=Pseudomonas sp. GD03860 TaxID=2975389 RepID=UPI002449D0BC|nr:DUF2116 family Zn-ribbon domain-containing protein [Pseudomonas sp. GD03860]MDH0640387.1 DUF2116 family Zn-ribbon domain-containing protein [Pseudomonas sp. GD03860]
MTTDNKHRVCAVCSADISGKRSDALTCSDRCRAKQSRKNKQQSVLVSIRVPLLTYTNMVIAAMKAKSNGVNEHLKSIVMEKFK